ncbi:YhjD/YihY/BrkB family envelope integrity protein [Bradyrhizobium sp. CCGB12]|uniref:YhjD/YihY/BrkB family envelope integrity protein n=1 Tax=Bradyrhizobium sp. CCGB12 TaxID=2949632 RepID=UPI00281229A1|nr:YhjD/YihY/BrkB family envelope integrity protein [Bradyrhizobium sp. CCGB12]
MDILLRVYSNISEYRVLARAAGMTYYSLLAIFPALAASIYYGLFSDPTAIAKHLDQVSGVLPGGAVDVALGEQEKRGFLTLNAVSLSFTLLFVLAALGPSWSFRLCSTSSGSRISPT